MSTQGWRLTDCFNAVNYCADLTPPLNGALACDNWIHGLICQMSCNEMYDISRTAPAHGQYVCSDTIGEWRPNDIVPGCNGKNNWSILFAGWMVNSSKLGMFFCVLISSEGTGQHATSFGTLLLLRWLYRRSHSRTNCREFHSSFVAVQLQVEFIFPKLPPLFSIKLRHVTKKNSPHK